MNNKTRNLSDCINKYFDDYYFMPTINEQIFFDIFSSIIKDTIESSELKNSLLEEFNENRAYIEKLAIKELKTIRELKHFNKLFKYNWAISKGEIYLPDIIIISIINTTRLDLYDFILKNKNFLTVDNQLLVLDPFFNMPLNIKGLDKLENLLNEEEREIIFELFPYKKYLYENSKQQEQNNDNGIANFSELDNNIKLSTLKQRLCLKYIFEQFFNAKLISLESYYSKSERAEFIHYFRSEEYDEINGILKIKKYLEHSDINYRSIWFSWIKDLAKNESNNYNTILERVIICLSKIRENINIDGYNRGSYLIWDYFARSKSDKDFLYKFLEITDNSDVFADNILYYTISPDKQTVYIKPGSIDEKKVIENYFNRINEKLKINNYMFNIKNFDDLESTMWLIFQAIKYVKDKKLNIPIIQNFKSILYKILENNAKVFEIFLKYYIIKSHNNIPAYLDLENIKELLSIDQTKELFKTFLDNVKSEDIDKSYSEAYNNLIEKSK